MSTDIVSTRPFAPSSLARDGSDNILPADGVTQLDLDVHLGALSTGKDKTPVDDGRAKAPLGNQNPPGSDETPAKQGVQASLGRGGGRVCKEEEEEGQRDPGPAALDEKDVEDVALAGKVRGRKSRVLGVGVVEGVVGGVANGRGEEGEEGAEGEHDGVRDEEAGFERRREEGRVSCLRGGRRRRLRGNRRGRRPICSRARVGSRWGVHFGGEEKRWWIGASGW